MNIFGLIFLIAAHYLTGIAILSIFSIRQKRVMQIAMAMILGILSASLLPMVLELCHIPITRNSVAISIGALTILLNITQFRKYNYSFSSIRNYKPNIRLYEVLFIIVFIALLIPSIWRCFYYPPNARDVLSGPEPMAAYTVQEHTMINSLFSVNIESTNNHLKPPYVTDLLIIYKLLVHPFGQTWLSILAISFLVWFYLMIREKLHPLPACMIMLFFICMPDPYGYTYIVLFDYSNMVLFFFGVYFLSIYLQSGNDKVFYFATLLFGFATFIRFDTLVLIGMLLPMLWLYYYQQKVQISKVLIQSGLLLLVPYIFYFVWVNIFIKYYMPITFDVTNELNNNLSDVSVFFQRISGMTTKIVFGEMTLKLFGLMTYLFLAILVADSVFFRSFNIEARIALYGILVVYIGLPFLGYLIPWFDLQHTTKRGFYKALPIMILYMRNSALLTHLSVLLNNFEIGKTHPGSNPAYAKSTGDKAIKGKKKR